MTVSGRLIINTVLPKAHCAIILREKSRILWALYFTCGTPFPHKARCVSVFHEKEKKKTKMSLRIKRIVHMYIYWSRDLKKKKDTSEWSPNEIVNQDYSTKKVQLPTCLWLLDCEKQRFYWILPLQQHEKEKNDISETTGYVPNRTHYQKLRARAKKPFWTES